MPRWWSLCCFSSNAPFGRFKLIWQGFTLENLRHPLRDKALTDAFITDAFFISLGLSLAATLLCFSLSFDDFVISSFIAGETVSLPLYLAGAFQREISPQIQLLSTLVLMVSGSALVIASPR
jgi:ABC-type spermidine/putrescine transport system permease subunit II